MTGHVDRDQFAIWIARMVDESCLICHLSSVNVPAWLKMHDIEIRVIWVVSRPRFQPFLLCFRVDYLSRIFLHQVTLLHSIDGNETPAFAMLAGRPTLSKLPLAHCSIPTVCTAVTIPVGILIPTFEGLVANTFHVTKAIQTPIATRLRPIFRGWFTRAAFAIGRVALGSISRIIAIHIHMCVGRRFGVYQLLEITRKAVTKLATFLSLSIRFIIFPVKKLSELFFLENHGRTDQARKEWILLFIRSIINDHSALLVIVRTQYCRPPSQVRRAPLFLSSQGLNFLVCLCFHASLNGVLGIKIGQLGSV
mmetsp:Transcript_40392/g.68890  ORF Transcript_40392/g.68890 Transcript_40392/m.68890 type:complete len:308 (+) Transcript_40392:822-1745(+)